MKKIAIFTFLFLLTANAYAGEHPTEPYTGSAPFEKLKGLAGKWTGTVVEGGQTEEKPATVDYEVSSGGSALIEKLGVGTPAEMVSIYNDENGKLVMTHFCLMRNQPKLKLVSADDKQIQLEMVEANGVKLTDSHMHSLKITFDGKDAMTQEWSGYAEGKPMGAPTVVKLTRVK